MKRNYSFINRSCLKGGNLILGVGPKPDGTLCEEDLAIMDGLGKWLDINGEGIYKTRRVND